MYPSAILSRTELAEHPRLTVRAGSSECFKELHVDFKMILVLQYFVIRTIRRRKKQVKTQ